VHYTYNATSRKICSRVGNTGRVLIVCLTGLLAFATLAQETYDLVIRNGRVIDPETKLDAVRSIGLRGSAIAAISERPLSGTETVDATGLVVAPGFIELHWHGRDPESDVYQAMDGVTTWFELEVGTDDVDAWYAKRAGNSLHGVSISNLKCLPSDWIIWK